MSFFGYLGKRDVTMRYRVYIRDGNGYWFHYPGTPFQNGRVPGYPPVLNSKRVPFFKRGTRFHNPITFAQNIESNMYNSSLKYIVISGNQLQKWDCIFVVWILKKCWPIGQLAVVMSWYWNVDVLLLLFTRFLNEYLSG